MNRCMCLRKARSMGDYSRIGGCSPPVCFDNSEKMPNFAIKKRK